MVQDVAFEDVLIFLRFPERYAHTSWAGYRRANTQKPPSLTPTPTPSPTPTPTTTSTCLLYNFPILGG